MRPKPPKLDWPAWIDKLARRGLARSTIATRILVRRSKSDAGTRRRPPIADNLGTVLADAWERQGRPREGKAIDRSVMSGKFARRVEKAWDQAGRTRITNVGIRTPRC